METGTKFYLDQTIWEAPDIPNWQLRDIRCAVDFCGLTDIEFEGYQFTWSNNQADAQHTELRLDRAAGSADWFEIFPSAKVSHLFTRNSDHRPILLRFRGIPSRRFRHTRKRFRFEAMWVRAEDCQKIITEHWDTTDDLLRNLHNCRIGLANWDKDVFGSVQKKFKELKKKLELPQQQDFTADVKSQIQVTKIELEEILDREEILWRQRSKVQWLAEGGRNTKFFHSKASSRAHRNDILSLLRDDGSSCEDQQSMGEVVNDYFRNSFRSRNPTVAEIEDVIGTMEARVDPAINQELSKEFTLEEVKQALLLEYCR